MTKKTRKSPEKISVAPHGVEQKRQAEVNAAGAAAAPQADFDECRAALLVMVKSPEISAWLTEHDPMALRQARKALRLGDDREDTRGRTLPPGEAKSWAPEVIADGSGTWCGNALRFATKEEAEANVFALSLRWMAVRDTRVVAVPDEPNYAWDVERGLVRLG